ncbi:transcriptional regulator, arsR-family protein [Mycobacterium tuberculosis RGTB423]|nr:transcriptional regulator, arsR-family protein [Mycobacterium tuberculosis RGTB423]
MAGQSDRKAALLDQVARVGKALANGRRLQILDLLAQGERAVEAIATATGMNLTTASANLAGAEERRAGRGSPRGDPAVLPDCWGRRGKAVRAGASGCRRASGRRGGRGRRRARFAGGCDHPCGAAAAARSRRGHPGRRATARGIPGRPYPGRHQYPDSRTGRPARRTSWRPRHCRLLSWCLLRHGPRCRPHRARRGAGGETPRRRNARMAIGRTAGRRGCTGRAWGLIARGAEGKSTFGEAAARTARCPA